jgi:hypothetical protein
MMIDATGDLRVTSVSTVTDNPRASIASCWDATIVGTSITLADNATETLSSVDLGRSLPMRAMS